MRITFLSDNKTEKSCCMAEWGLSVLIETRGKTLLFDVGASPLFAENAKALGIDLSEVEAVVISHGHYDHTEGMETFCEINKTAPIYIHKDAVSPAYGLARDGSVEDENCGIRWRRSFADEIKDRCVFTEQTHFINDDMAVSGDIKSLSPMTEIFYRPVSDTKKLKADDMRHEQILVVREDEGIHIFSGCSHTGVLSAIARAKELFPGEKIVSLTAGMHLYPLSAEKTKDIVEEIANMGIRYVFPVHCTGMRAIMMFKERMGKSCKIAAAGDAYEC